MGLAYLAAVAKADGHQVDVVESAYTGQTVQEITEQVFSGNYHFVGITCYYYNFKYVIKIVNHIRRQYPDIYICLGGFLPTLSYEMVLNALPDIHCCIVGEGEKTFCELLECLENQKSWQHIPGIAFRNSSGEVVLTARRELIDDLDSLPFPHRTFISERRLASIVTTRGCYGTCNYCGIQEFTRTCVGKRFRRRSPDNVFAEILTLAAQGVEYIMFNDGLFHMSSATGRKWFNRFYELHNEHGLKMRYLCDFRANEVVACRDIIERFMEIGLYNVNIGIESFVQKQLDFYGKGTTVEQNIQTLDILQDLELNFTMGIMMFDPTTTMAEILEFTETIQRMGFYQKIYNVNRPLSIGCCVIATQGTELFDYVVKNGLYEMNELNYTFIRGV